MTNPFDDKKAIFLALVNDVGQHSLWPCSINVPSGWAVAHGPDKRKGCLDYIEENWTTMGSTTSSSLPFTD